MHYDLGALSLWLGVGVALIVGGVQVAGWRHRLVIGGLIVAGSACILAALTFPLFANGWPLISGFMSRAAASPSSWVSLLLFIAALVLFSKPTTAMDVPSGMDAKVSQTFETMDEYFEGRLKAVGENLGKIWTSLNAFKETLEIMDKRTCVPQNLGDTVTEAFESVQGALQSQLARMRDETNGFRGKLNSANMDLIHLLDFSINQATVAFLDDLIERGPKFLPETADQLAPEERATRYGETIQYIDFVRASIGGTNRGMSYRGALEVATSVVDNKISAMPRDSFPPDVDLTFYRNFAIASLQRMRTQGFLWAERQEVVAMVRNARSNLIANLNTRRQ